MLKLDYNKKGVVFSVNVDGKNIPFHEWSATDDCIYYQPLAALVDNGQANFTNHECTVLYENLYFLNEDERSILGVPRLYDKAIRLRGVGMLSSNDFQYKIELLTHIPAGEIIAYHRVGNIIVCDGEEFLLSETQFELINKIENYNNTPVENKTTDFNLRQFSEIRELAIQAKCELDSYLQNENVYAPERIKIIVGQDEEGYSIKPAIETPDNEKFQSIFDKMKRVQGVYPVPQSNGGRIRVVLNDNQKENLAQLKKAGKYRTQEDIQKIIEHPTEYFDPEIFDLSDFYSDRVIEIGVYKPKFYPFVSPYKSSWIAGATIQSLQNGTTKLTISNENDLRNINAAIELATENKRNYVEYDSAEIDVEDAKFLADIAAKQLNSPNQPVEVEDNQMNSNRKVLIIKDNAEVMDFAVKDKIKGQDAKLRLFNDSFLNDKYSLKEHQKEGVAWLQYLYINEASGCLLADDMGLGKTLQILYFIDWHSRNYVNHKPYLLVAPVSLLENWENEYNRFFNSPRLNIVRVTSKNIPRRFDKFIVDKLQRMDIILTNYETLRNAQLNLCAVDFDIVVLDEAQKIKSPGTLVTNAAKALKGKFKISMTGTPVENTLLDLWSIMDFCVPGFLGNAKSFASQYQTPLKNGDTDLVSLGNKLHDKLGMYFMRRLKRDVAKDLPNKIELKQPMDMPSVQSNFYKHVVDDYVSGSQPNMLLTIMDIRKVSEHPYLYDSTLMQHSVQDMVDTSARLQATVVFLDRIKAMEEKVIIFAERKETQKMLWHICRKRYGVTAKIINGDTPSIVARPNPNIQTRQQSIDEFQSVDGFNVIIMSPVAAGMGLNVTAANHVIHYSRHWNPAKENQATDRAYRIGQKRDVYVYYPMAVSKDFKSFDTTLDELLSRKTSLAESTIFPTERIKITQEELGHILFES